MTFHIDIQNAAEDPLPLSETQLTQIATSVLQKHREAGEITLRLVGVKEITELNHQYRKKNKATNVLAFPSSLPKDIVLDCPFLGDVVLCPLVIMEESIQYHKTPQAHSSLILIHGILHLLGYDHNKEAEATLMQSIEIEMLAELGYDNPYSKDGTLE